MNFKKSVAAMSIYSALLGAVVGPAYADSSSENPVFDQVDSDGDGAVSKSEIAGARSAVKQRLDKNGDGKLGRYSREEKVERVKSAIQSKGRLGSRAAQLRGDAIATE